jgi:two-component sensor histidine kinase
MRILFVDDDPDTRALARRSVMQEFPGAEALEATDKPDLTAALGTGPIDILVADYDLRWIDGFEVHALTREANPDCVAVMFTGTGDEELAVRAMKSGFDDYVVKAPGQLKRLAASVRAAWERSAERTWLRDNRELMRQELYHRLHNNLQLVISLMALTMRSIADQNARREVRALMGRIQSLSLLQERFYRSDDLRRIDIAGFVAELVAERREAAPGLVVETRLEPLTVSVDQAVPLGLVANEMLSLHVEDAAPSTGVLFVELSRDAGRVALAIRSDRRAAAEASAGLGLDLIRRLAVQLDAEVAHDADQDLSSTRISFAG